MEYHNDHIPFGSASGLRIDSGISKEEPSVPEDTEIKKRRQPEETKAKEESSRPSFSKYHNWWYLWSSHKMIPNSLTPDILETGRMVANADPRSESPDLKSLHIKKTLQRPIIIPR
ncbi:hypothetical protein AVEN_241411-1 [Araneus ventricosus]|uniref:Uncharacterized protein n=1 Tax=Araneus ventricosus TaxID=182803 RepID=A0A4Y2M675_ARAVE|nr:hypothetical protein AVEN_241411-1 [Araneus ventricosus]